MSVAVVAISNNVQTVREHAAAELRVLMREWSTNTIGIGLKLMEVRETFTPNPRPGKPRPGWKVWLKQHVGIGEKHAASMIYVAEKFGHLKEKALPSQRVLSFLARARTPKAATREVLRRVGKGERIGKQKATAIADKHRPRPKEANRLAKETGKPVMASDGFIYFGTSVAKAREAENRRTIVYSVRRAVECLSAVEMTPHQFLTFALPHQLWRKDEDAQIGRALKWLNALHTAWEVRQ